MALRPDDDENGRFRSFSSRCTTTDDETDSPPRHVKGERESGKFRVTPDAINAPNFHGTWPFHSFGGKTFLDGVNFDGHNFTICGSLKMNWTHYTGFWNVDITGVEKCHFCFIKILRSFVQAENIYYFTFFPEKRKVAYIAEFFKFWLNHFEL